MFKTLYDDSLFKLFMTTTAFRMDHGALLLAIAMPIVTLAAFVLLGMDAFRRREIQ